MTLSLNLPDPDYCKTKRKFIEWECLVHRSSYYFSCEYAVEIVGAYLCAHPNKEKYDKTCQYNVKMQLA